MQELVENARANREAEIASAMHFLNSALGAGASYDPTRPDHGRASVRAALVGVIRLIGALFPDAPALPISLNHLLYALHDLDRGKVAPFLDRHSIQKSGAVAYRGTVQSDPGCGSHMPSQARR